MESQQERGVLLTDYAESYIRDGFTCAKSILPIGDVRRLSDELPAVIQERRIAGLPTGLNVWVDSPAAMHLATAPSILSIAVTLLGDTNLRILHDQAFLREAGSRGTPPHQDLPHWGLETTLAVTAWIPLTTSKIADGSIVYMRGSHKAGILETAGDIRKGEGWQLLNQPALSSFNAVAVETELGDVIFHHPLVIHYTPDTSATTDRRCYTVIYIVEQALCPPLGLRSTHEYITAVSPRVVLRKSPSRFDRVELITDGGH